MIKYETLFIMKPELTDEEIQTVLDRLQERVEKVNGKVAIQNHWGERELAYMIKYRGQRLFRGYYVLMTYVGDGQAVEEVERNIRILDPTFRYITVRLEEGVDPASITEIEIIKREDRSRARAAAPPPPPPPPTETKPDEQTTPPAEDASAAEPAAEAAAEPVAEAAAEPAAEAAPEPAADESADPAPQTEEPATEETKPAEPAAGDDEPAAGSESKEEE